MKTPTKLFFLLTVLGSFSLYSQVKPCTVNATDFGADLGEELPTLRFFVPDNGLDAGEPNAPTGYQKKPQLGPQYPVN